VVQDTDYQFLSKLVEYCRRYDNIFGCFYAHSVYILWCLVYW